MAPDFFRLNQDRRKPHFLRWSQVSCKIFKENRCLRIHIESLQKGVVGGLVRFWDKCAVFDRELSIEHIAKAHGCTAELDYQVGYPVTSNDPDATAQYQAIANDLIGPEKAPPFELPCMGAEDFSYYGQHVPACFFALGLIPDGQEAMPSVHHPKFDFTDQALPIGIRMFCGLALQACPD